jgi:SPP1 gp7 family putative phage head morphogenesis protein
MAKKIKKLPKIKAPISLEREYQTKIRKLITRVKEIIEKNVVGYLPTIMADIELKRIRTDDIGDDVFSLFKSVRQQLGAQITDREIENMVQENAQKISKWNKEQVTGVMKKALGLTPFIAEPFLAEQLKIFTINNVNLIKNVSNDFVNQTEQIVFDGMRRGLRHEEIAKQILDSGKDELGKVSRFKNAQTRANLIGRDQVNKLNGNLNQLRQESVGVKTYIWRTVGDDRVRDSHEALEGREFSWSEGAPGGIHPGDEINCRCYAEPNLAPLLSE